MHPTCRRKGDAMKKNAEGVNRNVIHKQHKSGAWYTPPDVRAVALEVLGAIDLDPCTHASNPLGASSIYTIRDSAFKHDWAAELAAKLDQEQRGTASLWMNPPYSRGIGKWLDRWHETIEALAADRFVVRGLLFVPCRTDTAWYQDASWQRSQATCELSTRTRFERWHRGRMEQGDSARWGTALIYYGPDRKAAAAKLRALGNVRMSRRWDSPRVPKYERQIPIEYESTQLALVK